MSTDYEMRLGKNIQKLRKMRDFAKRSGERVERRLELASYFGCLALVVVCVSALARGGFTPYRGLSFIKNTFGRMS